MSLKYIKYDPNYSNEADDAVVGGFMDTKNYEDIDSEEYSDVDDMSWKVRHSAAKCLEAVILTRPDFGNNYFNKMSSTLIARFNERKENVKTIIMRIYIELLCSTRPNYDEVNPDVKKQVPEIVRNIKPLMSKKSMKTRQDCFSLLRELLRVIPSTFANNLNHCKSLVSLVVASVFDPCKKIATEALLVLQHLDKVIRPADGGMLLSFKNLPKKSLTVEVSIVSFFFQNHNQQKNLSHLLAKYMITLRKS